MREYLYRGIRVDNHKLVEGYYVKAQKLNGDGYEHFIIEESADGRSHLVIPESVGEYTGMNEFVLIDEMYNAKLFEGDIVEVWGWRTVRGRNQSQYDQEIKVRGVIRFQHGEWCIDYDNNYNRLLAKLKGAEVQERNVSGSPRMYDYGYHGSDIEKYRAYQLKWHRKFHNDDEIVHHDDIRRIGTEFENSELLED